ncbi:MAG: RNA methyltransferase [Cyclobacteriaceae bacterium]|nr:RNA methyltransferase [Cyclobacteriaceae bacterium HetDA_MAG_MS6]
MRKLKNDELQRLETDEFKKAAKTNICLVLDNIRSMQNIGSAFRTADAFRVAEVYLTGISARPPHREIQKTALGATESVSWKYFENNLDLIQHLQAKNYQIIPVEQAERSCFLQDYNPDSDKKYALVFGNEVFGVSDEFMESGHTCLEIPQYGTKHSLNVSVSVGVVLWDLFQKMGYTNL